MAAIAGVVVVAVAGWAGCSSSSSDPAPSSSTTTVVDEVEDIEVSAGVVSWHEGLCRVFTSWQEVIGAGVPPLVAGAPDEDKVALAAYLRALAASAEEQFGSLQAAGAPDLPDGEVIQGELESAMQKASQEASALADEVEALVSDPATYEAAAAELRTRSATTITDSGKSFLGLSMNHPEAYAVLVASGVEC